MNKTTKGTIVMENGIMDHPLLFNLLTSKGENNCRHKKLKILNLREWDTGWHHAIQIKCLILDLY